MAAAFRMTKMLVSNISDGQELPGDLPASTCMNGPGPGRRGSSLLAAPAGQLECDPQFRMSGPGKAWADRGWEAAKFTQVPPEE